MCPHKDKDSVSQTLTHKFTFLAVGYVSSPGRFGGTVLQSDIGDLTRNVQVCVRFSAVSCCGVGLRKTAHSLDAKVAQT